MIAGGVLRQAYAGSELALKVGSRL
ncbi:MAG: hypothetical protein RLZZ584_2188, partial [Pseudomonadota bacterium]